MLNVWDSFCAYDPEPISGVLICCFGDPGLFLSCESSACPFTGQVEASFIGDTKYGEFVFVTCGERFKPMLERMALSVGLAPLLLHIEMVQPAGA